MLPLKDLLITEDCSNKVAPHTAFEEVSNARGGLFTTAAICPFSYRETEVSIRFLEANVLK